MASSVAENALPRAKRLKLLREAKARKDSAKNSYIEASTLPLSGEQTSENEPMQQKDVLQLTTKTNEMSEDLVEKIAQVQDKDTKPEDESDEELLNLAPKRANWDMERDIEPMLRKLERRTQHAIVEILREKLSAEQHEEGSDDNEVEDIDDEETEEADE